MSRQAFVCLLISAALCAGCTNNDQPATNPGNAPSQSPRQPDIQPSNSPPAATPRTPNPPVAATPPTVRPRQPAVAPPSREDAELLFGPDDPADSLPPKPTFDEGKIRTAGIRRVESKHLILYTDLPPNEVIDQFPKVFDLAVPKWCEYFEVDPAKAADWQMIGCLIEEKNRFAGAGLLPDDLPPFPHAYHRDWQFWIYKQPGDYYDRHLVLHEGTHAFMRAFLGSAGPPWFMEGLAEYLGTHRWADGKLTMGYMPRDNDQVPYWGRVKIIADDYAANRAESLENVLHFGAQAHLRTEAYAWSWAAVTLLAEHLRSKEAFRSMFAHVGLGASSFAAKLKQELGDAWPELEENWQLMVVNIDYGYDVAANAIKFKPGEELPAAGAEVEISAARGWQSSGYRLRRGERYKLTASGQYVIGTEPKPWTCEPGGVTIRYHRGRPLGMLLGAIRPQQPRAESVTPLATPGVIGLSAEIAPEIGGVLYLSINEHPAEWNDNRGTVTVRIEPVGGED